MSVVSAGTESEAGRDTWAPARVNSTLRLPLTLLALSLLMLAVILNVTSLSSALPTISQDLGLTSVQAFWAGTSSLICSTTFQPVYGSLSSIVGRKPMMLIAIVSFTAGTVTASRASTATTLLVGRSIQGLGAGGITNLSEVILTDLVPLRLRGRYLAGLNSVWAIGSTSGPVVGAALAQEVDWRWLFYINLPLITLGLTLMILFTRLQPLPVSQQHKPGGIDFGGILLFTGGITSVLIPVTWGGVMYAWSSWHTLTPLLTGIAALVCFVTYEGFYVPANPVISLALFRTRSLLAGYIGTMTHGLILSCGLYYLPFYFQAVKGYTPIISGVALFPVTFTVVPGAMATGILISRLGRYRALVWAGWLATTLGLGLTCLVHVTTTNALWIVCLIVIGLGLGMLFSALNLAVLAAAPSPTQTAAAATMFTFFRALGQTLGVALGGTIFANRVRAHTLADSVLEAIRTHTTTMTNNHLDPVALVSLIDQIPDPETKRQIRTVFVDSLRVVWAFCCAMSGVAGLLSLGMRHYELARRVGLPRPRCPNQTALELDGCTESRQDPVTMHPSSAKGIHTSLRSIPESDRGSL
ncbi:MFS general substrate transporter [Aspergillus aculeatinus CBS 121060]|uniref:MFS general substrate transporter n=1 Tax=Aspergillus aculeatinus CBS 121060 TaxID=1448322 RepID=A0ACD1HHK4_9EURO|nr:MFS general substrate transporter [Aspergillus aculeatinus CBS 121060]RAH72996.1 MFS general substrate transporter [Aspergillus aculeatinus CBS 121060]